MAVVFDLAEEALQNGNPPIGAVYYDRATGDRWGARTTDKTTRKINGHAEINVYDLAHLTVGDDLSSGILLSTARLCSSCTPPYAEGNIGRIITAAPRRLVFPLTGLMRARKINMHELLEDGATDTVSVKNYELDRALELFALYAQMNNKRKGHKVPYEIDPILEPYVEKYALDREASGPVLKPMRFKPVYATDGSLLEVLAED